MLGWGAPGTHLAARLRLGEGRGRHDEMVLEPLERAQYLPVQQCRGEHGDGGAGVVERARVQRQRPPVRAVANLALRLGSRVSCRLDWLRVRAKCWLALTLPCVGYGLGLGSGAGSLFSAVGASWVG